MKFRDREDAARRLAEKLVAFRGKNPLVLGIPRGAVPMAELLAHELEGELDVVLMSKISAPYEPEVGIGSVAEHGERYVIENAKDWGATPEYIEREIELSREGLRWRRLNYDPTHEPIDPRGRIVIIVDDGVATGSTLIGALRVIRNRRPAVLVAAVGVAPKDLVEKLSKEADQVAAAHVPDDMQSVGEFFEDFPQVSDVEVSSILRRRPRAVTRR
jgi:predicted phosphoribosyltransferase